LFENRLLHLVARVALRAAHAPARAKRIVDAVGRLLPPLTLGEAMVAAQELEGAGGTCLTRALTIAARLPRSDIVIGSDGPTEGSFSAHAWVERDGTVISASPPARVEIARL
jgi:hypothetical protein